MDIQKYIPSASALAGFGRHVVTFVAGATAMAAGMHAISPDQATGIQTDVSGIVNGLTSVIGGVSGLIGIGMGLYAGWQSTNASKVAAVAAVPGQKVLTDPATAASIPNPDVVSNAEHEIVSKG